MNKSQERICVELDATNVERRGCQIRSSTKVQLEARRGFIDCQTEIGRKPSIHIVFGEGGLEAKVESQGGIVIRASHNGHFGATNTRLARSKSPQISAKPKVVGFSTRVCFDIPFTKTCISNQHNGIQTQCLPRCTSERGIRQRPRL